MSGGKTYTIQFRTSSNRIATAKIRYQGGPLQGKELLKRSLCSMECHISIMIECWRNSKRLRKVMMVFWWRSEISSRGRKEVGRRKVYELASRLWSDKEEDEEENVYWIPWFGLDSTSSQSLRISPRVWACTGEIHLLPEPWRNGRSEDKS